MTKPPPFGMDDKAIFGPLEELLTIVLNKLDREWPPAVPYHEACPTILRGLLAVARNHLRTIRYICAEDDDPARRLEYYKCAAPLVRVELEVLYSIAFILENVPERTELFEKATWRNMWQDLKWHEAAFGTDPDWAPYLAKQRALVIKGQGFFKVTPEEVADPENKIKYWPLPSRMQQQAAPALRAYLKYLDDWFYGSFSEDAHVKGVGFMRQFAGLLSDITGDIPVTENFKRQKGVIVAAAAVLMVALLSEIELVMRFGLTEKLKYLWTLVNELSTRGKGLYQHRYEGNL